MPAIGFGNPYVGNKRLKDIYFNAPPPPVALQAPRQSLGDMVADKIATVAGKVLPKQTARKLGELAHYSPVEAISQGFDTGAALRQSKYGQAAVNGLETALNFVPDGAVAGKVAHSIIAPLWHGSPHKFEKFALEKIGTGEGAQAYGHGLYFAENPAVAREYQENLGRSLNLKGASFNPDGTPNRAGYVAELLDAVGPKRIDDIREGLKTIAPEAPDHQIAKWLEEGTAKYHAANTGHLYEVKLDANPEDFLDWDAPLGQQPESAKRLAETLDASGRFGRPLSSFEPRGHDLASRAAVMPNGLRVPSFQTEQMLSAGIPGIRYLDQGSRTAGQGTHNYVVFDPSIIDILNRH